MLRLVVATLLVLAAYVIGISSVLANWPTTCVEANDSFEYSAGRYQNIGIYQRVFATAAEAEAACQQDHRDDIRFTFAWAFPEVSVPAPQPAPQAFRIDADLQPAWDLLITTNTGQILLRAPRTHTVKIRWSDQVDSALYEHFTHTIWFHPKYRSQRVEAVAAILAHELWHVGSQIPRPLTYATCLEEETFAYMGGALAWRELYPGNVNTDLEASLTEDWRALYADEQLGRVGSGGDVSWTLPNLYARVLYVYNYTTYCQRYT